MKVTLTGDLLGTLATFRDGLFTGTPAVLAIDNTTPGTVILTWTSSGVAACPVEVNARRGDRSIG